MNRKGLTILEIILSVAIIAVAAVVILKVFVSAQTLNDRTQDHDEAVFEAVSMLEMLSYEEIEPLFEQIIDPGSVSKMPVFQGFEIKKDGGVLVCSKKTASDLLLELRVEPQESALNFRVKVFRSDREVYDISKKMYLRSLK